MKTIHNIWVLALLSFAISCEKTTLEEQATIASTDFKSSFKTNKKTLKIKLINDEASFEKREGHTSVTYDNTLWVIGGHKGYDNVSNDIWRSEDGVVWKQLLAAKHFSPRTSNTTTIFKNSLWVIGGTELPNRKNDVWRSGDGVFWKEVTNNAGFSERSSHTALAFDKKLWVIGGLKDNHKSENDVWYTKNGIDWIQATPNAAFPPRFDHTSFVHDSKMWVVGGKDGYPSKIDVKNDVWYSKNGVDWVQATPNAAFLPRGSHTSVIYDKKMWVLGGSDNASNKFNDAWCSKDGVVWKQVLEHEALKRAAHTTTVYDKKMWVIGGTNGMYTNDVWALD